MPGGRPSKYDPERMPELARKFCLLGATNEALARNFEVDVATLERWIREKPEFRVAIKAGREEADANIGSRLYDRAMGYSHPETKVFVDKGQVITHQVIKHYPPETAAMIFWLKNRRPDLWRDKREITGEGGGPIQIAQVELVAPDVPEED